MRHALASPDFAHDGKGLVEQEISFLEVDTECEELRLQIAGADAEGHSTARQPVKGRNRLREKEGVTERERREVRHQPDLGCRSGGKRQTNKRVERVVPACFQPLVAGDRMLGEKHSTKARVFGSFRDRSYRRRAEELVAVRMIHKGQAQRELHGTVFSSCGGGDASHYARPMSSDVITSPTKPELDEGDHDRFAHYVIGGGEAIMRSAVTGEPVTALCGKVWVPSRDPKSYPVCPTCKQIQDGRDPNLVD